MKPITKPDVRNEDPEYWEGVLHSHGLGLEDASLLSLEDDEYSCENEDENDVDDLIHEEEIDDDQE